MAFLHRFQQLFNQHHGAANIPQDLLPNSLTEEDNRKLCSLVTLEELKRVVFQMPPNRALGEDLKRQFPQVITTSPRWVIKDMAGSVGHQLGMTGGVAVVVIVAILFIFLHRMGAIALVLLPVTLGCISTAALMGYLGVELNLFNFIVLPILIGIGIDDGIHIYQRQREQQNIAITLTTTGRPILITTLTTACGFGSLSLAGYHVLKGMGLIAVFGVSTCFFYSIATLPALLALGGGKTPNKVRNAANTLV